MSFLKNFLADEEGQSTTEYILILAVVVMIAMKFGGRLSGSMKKMTNKLDTQFESAMDGNFDDNG